MLLLILVLPLLLLQMLPESRNQTSLIATVDFKQDAAAAAAAAAAARANVDAFRNPRILLLLLLLPPMTYSTSCWPTD
jgi:hypothetical protein